MVSFSITLQFLKFQTLMFPWKIFFIALMFYTKSNHDKFSFSGHAYDSTSIRTKEMDRNSGDVLYLDSGFLLFPPPPFSTAEQPLVDEGLFIIDVSWWHSDTPHSVEILWISDQHNAEASTWQHTAFIRDKTPVGIRTRNPSKQAAAGTRLRLRGHWDRVNSGYPGLNLGRAINYRREFGVSLSLCVLVFPNKVSSEQCWDSTRNHGVNTNNTLTLERRSADCFI